ncbi:carbohydrate sulfotransferase 11 isoform X3 [Harmonia axyridis]|uniref:carbohydrate sulfotransferase 11 isoform X3 n=1 Tax=Harmonia axyridis TaxID=115357 RepID=UPI001E277E3F|nr:carbohydrate sulfotransferase 11 isoform X3 [Harmonia axyridis]
MDNLDLDKEIENLSHEDLLEITQSILKRLIAADSLLKDLPLDVTTEEVLSQIAVEQGQSITVTVLRGSDSPVDVVVACTNWKRVMMVLTGTSNVTNLLEIPSHQAHSENSTVRLSQYPYKDAMKYLKTYTTFMIVRHPMERLLSAFRNKFEGNLTSSKYFQRRYGRRIIKKYRSLSSKKMRNSGKPKKPLGSDVTLNEFVQYLINEGLQSNEHWTSVYNLCHPCKINYNFIGKYEHLTEDTESILNFIDAPPVKFPMTNSAHTRSKVREYFQTLPLRYMESLYNLYKNDFLLFDYNLESVLGFDFG